jgi:probable rRNA maturation factor
MLAALDRSDAELSVLLTDDRRIESLNRQYRDKARPTDVLSFHFEPMGAPAPLEAGWLLGDIVISLETAARQAQGRKRPLEEEVRWLLAHGLLHLVGYDHANPEEKRVMVNWTKKLVRAAGNAPTTSAATKAKTRPAKSRSAAAARAETTPAATKAKTRPAKSRSATATRAKTTRAATKAQARPAKSRSAASVTSSASKAKSKHLTPVSTALESGSKRRSVARSARRAPPRATEVTARRPRRA